MSNSNPFVKTNWVNEETEISAEQLNRIEQGIYDAHEAILDSKDDVDTLKESLLEENTTDTAKKATSDANGDPIDATYATKDELAGKVSKGDGTGTQPIYDDLDLYKDLKFRNGVIKSVNGKVQIDLTDHSEYVGFAIAVNFLEDNEVTFAFDSSGVEIADSNGNKLLYEFTNGLYVNEVYIPNEDDLFDTEDYLQSQIDALNAAQNLADIVADLTALNALPTTNLQSNDKVQVILDSNHNDASTIYRWTGLAWDYVGSYGNSGYTKAEINAMMNNKQNVINSNNKLSSDLIDDTDKTHKFVTSAERSLIAQNFNNIANIKNGTNINSFADVESALQNAGAVGPEYTSINMFNTDIESYFNLNTKISATVTPVSQDDSEHVVIELSNAQVKDGVIILNAKNVSVKNGIISIE